MSAQPRPRTGAVAAGRGRLRISRDDREHAIETLKAAFVQDRLAKDEFEARLGQALVARTQAELAAVIADLPACLVPAQPPPPLLAPVAPPPVRTRPRVSMNTAVTAGACLVIGANMSMLFALLTSNAAGVVLVAVLTVIGAAIAIGAMIVAS